MAMNGQTSTINRKMSGINDVVSFVDSMLVEAYNSKTSDIHIEPFQDHMRIRFRQDGVLNEYSKHTAETIAHIISRIKILAQLDISEKRRPQEGRIRQEVNKQKFDCRVSILPTMHGEKIALRLLDSSSLQIEIENLGFDASQAEIVKEAIHRPYGLCLVTGPADSGKTTTLYSALLELNNQKSNIYTVEDPVEFDLDSSIQVSVKSDIGYTYQAALKTILKQDPDVIMIGEIRDQEVGAIAIEASLSRNMVLSTLHTTDVTSTISRLLSMGIEPYLIASSLNIIISQRLCKTICPSCKVLDESITPQKLVSCGFAQNTASKIQVYTGKGCEECNGTGHKGRVAVFEVAPITEEIKDLIIKQSSESVIKTKIRELGVKSLRVSALTKVAQGHITLEEAMSSTIKK